VLQLSRIRAGGAGSPSSWLVDQFPFTIGRSASAGLRLDAPGVWDAHAAITLDASTSRLRIEPHPDAVLFINGEKSGARDLRSGDVLAVGAEELAVSLSPALQTGLAAREALVWLVLGAVCAVQALLAARWL